MIWKFRVEPSFVHVFLTTLCSFSCFIFYKFSQVQARELDSSCSCEFNDLVGSEMSFSCDSSSFGFVTYTSSSFGEEGSIMELSYTSGYVGIIDHSGTDGNSAHYASSGSESFVFQFMLDPTAEALEDGECLFDATGGDYEGTPLLLVSFGCWACPTTDIPTSVPSSYPSNQPSINPESDGECCCCEVTKDPSSLLYYSLKALLF